MNRTPLIIIILLWIINIAASFIILRGTEYFSKLSGVYFICMVGSIVTVRSLIQKLNSNQAEEKEK